MALTSIDSIGKVDGEGSSWDELVTRQISDLSKTYKGTEAVNKILGQWHRDITLGIKRNPNYSPHINGFYMVWMVHGTWYEQYKKELDKDNLPNISKSVSKGPLNESTINSSFNMLATDIDVPDITEEYISVSSRIRNSFIPSRDYFVSDFSISYIENVNLEVIRYHEAWMKYLELIKRGEVDAYSGTECANSSRGPFLDIPFANAVWVAVFHPFTTDIQLLIKLVGVMPVTMPLKQVVGNRSTSKMTVLNLQYKAADIFYKFYNGTEELLADKDGNLFKSFETEILKPLEKA